MEVHPAQVTGSVIALIVPLACLTGLAIGKKVFLWRRVDGHPDFTRLSVDAISMATQFVLTPEAIGIVIACRALQSEYSSGRSLCRRLKGWRSRRRLDLWSCHNRLFRWRRLYRFGSLGSRGGASGRLLFHFGFRSCWRHLFLRCKAVVGGSRLFLSPDRFGSCFSLLVGRL